MKRNVLPLLIGICLLLSGCAAHNASTQAASQEWRLQSLEESFLDFQEAQRKEAERSRKAEEALAKRLDRLEARLTALTGEGLELPAEPVKPAPAKSVPTQSVPAAPAPNPVSKSAPKPAQAKAEPAAPESLPAPVKAGPESDEEKPWEHVPGPALEAQVRKPGPQPAAKPAPKPATTAPVASAASPQTLYEKGLNLIRSGRAAPGRSTLEQFLKTYPKHPLAPNALYWIGEGWYGEKNYPQAILAFKDVVAKYPKHAKAQAALLKIGMSYRNVGDKDNAVFYLRTLVDDHPGSEPARLAEQQLREIPN